MNSAEIAKIFKWGGGDGGLKKGDVISLYGDAYKITDITDTQVFGVQIVEKGRDVESKTVNSLNLTLEGWRLITS